MWGITDILTMSAGAALLAVPGFEEFGGALFWMGAGDAYSHLA